jgi:hypothetical protein
VTGTRSSTDKRLVVFHPGRLPPLETGGFAGWIYADEDSEQYEAAALAFTPTPPIISPRQFQAEAAELRRDFVAWTDSNLSGTSVENWLSTPLHRCTFPSPAPPIFLHVVWLLIIDRLVSQGQVGPLAIVTAHRGFVDVLCEVARRNEVPLRIVGTLQQRFDVVRIRLRAVAALGKALIDIAARLLMSRLLLGRRQLERLRTTRILIDTYLHRADLSATGEFNDRYFPGLVQWYRNRGIDAAVYPFLFRIRLRDIPGMYQAMARSAVPMAPFELFLTPIDLVRALVASTTMAATRRYAGICAFRSTDMTPLLPTPGFVAALSAFIPFLLLRVPDGMARHGIRPSLVLDWHENQPIDKATVYGFTGQSIPAAVIGVRQYVPVANYLSEYSTPAEVAARLAPHEQWVCGPSLPQQFDMTASGVRYRVVPALRFAHLYDSAQRGEGGNNLLVLLTHSLSESVQILAMVLSHTTTKPNVCHRIVIKPQPNVPKTAAAIRRIAERRWLNLICETFVVWSGESMAQLLNDAKLVVSSSTSATLEAVCRGIPVVIVGNRVGLDAIPLAQVDQRIWRLAYDQEEYRIAVGELSDQEALPPAMRAEIAEKTRADYFCPTNEDTMKAFIELPPAASHSGQ